jgi:hypothetical protein
MPKGSIILKYSVLILGVILLERGSFFLESNIGATTGHIPVNLGTDSSQQDSGYNSLKYLHGLRL